MRPTPVRCGDLAVGECEHRPPAARQATTAGELGATMGDGSSGGRGMAAAGQQGSGQREKQFGGICSKCHWWAGPGGGVGWRARTSRSVRGDANRTAFASPWTPKPKYVWPLGWVFPGPGQNQTESGVRGLFASDRWTCPQCSDLSLSLIDLKCESVSFSLPTP
jgi:hypothetical protein